MSKTIILKNVRISFPNLFEPKAVAGSVKKRTGATFLIGGKGSENYKAVVAAIEEVKKEQWPKGAPSSVKVCLHDCAEKSELEGYEAGEFFIAASRQESQGLPMVINRDKSPITDRVKVYAGCRVNAKINIWAQEHKEYGKRINAGLEVVQFVADDEPFSGSRPKADDMPDEGNNGDGQNDDALG